MSQRTSDLLSEQDRRRLAGMVAEILPNDDAEAKAVTELALQIKRWENGRAKLVSDGE